MTGLPAAATDARPLVVLDERVLAAVCEQACAGLAAWGRDWLGGPPPRPQACAAGEAPRHETFEHWRGERGAVWIRWEPADDVRLVEAVAGASALQGPAFADEWIAQLARRARRLRNAALCAALADGTGTEPAEAATMRLPRALFAGGAGTVRLEAPALGLVALVDRAAWQGLPCVARDAGALLPAPVPLESAMGGARLRLDVMLGSVELELPRILQLRAGDVLRLPRRLDEPLVVACAGRPLAHAVLGERQGRRSVQLLAATP
jgi:hypothetical protein